MPLLTFKEAKESTLADIAGQCPDSAQFAAYVNKATRMLMTRGNWWGTVQKMQFCVYGRCITWGRYVSTVLAVSTCGAPIPVWNNWYSFMPLSRNDFGSCFQLSTGRACIGNLAISEDGTSPVFNPITCGANVYVRIYPNSPKDAGKVVTVYGVNNTTGQVIRTERADGTIQEGVEMVLAVPFVSSPFPIRDIVRINKPETQDVLRFYQYDAVNDVLLDLVSYAPTETNPMYRHTKVVGGTRLRGNVQNGCDGLRQVQALVKLEFVPVKNDNDLVLIENLDALQDMILSIRAKDAGNIDESKALEASAIRELNLEVRNKFPLDQIPINIVPGAAIGVNRVGVGRII